MLRLVGGVERGLGFFERGQALFVFGRPHGQFGQLGLFFFGFDVVFFYQNANLLLLLADALHLRLRGLFVALDALVQVLAVADLLFKTGNLFAQHAAPVGQIVGTLLLRLFFGLQGADVV